MSVLDTGKDYRYTLVRSWDPRGPAHGPIIAWIGLNPSTADTVTDDPTVRKIRGFSQRWGFGRMLLVNLYPMRATDPRELIGATIGQRMGFLPDTADEIIFAAFMDSDAVVFAWGAWGNHKALRDRRDYVLALPRPDKPFWHLGLTKSGDPRHPLRLAYNTERQPWID